MKITVTPQNPIAPVSRDAEFLLTFQGMGLVTGSINVMANGQPLVLGGSLVAAVGFLAVLTAFTADSRTYRVSALSADTPSIALHATGTASGETAREAFLFRVDQPQISELRAVTFPEGNRVDLTWRNGSGTTRVRILRSQKGHPRLPYDPDAEAIYAGVAVTNFTDTVAPGAYYYTVFLSSAASAPMQPEQWLFSADGMVTGLSIEDYEAAEGNYVYQLLPKAVRRADQSTLAGDDRGLAESKTRNLLAVTNLFRGWLSALGDLRDPDLMPAGQIGIPSNQDGLLRAAAKEQGIPVDMNAETSSLRRLVTGISTVQATKGTCPSLVALAKLSTGWDVRCEQENYPHCGSSRVMKTWDGKSTWYRINPTSNAPGVSAVHTAETPTGDIVELPTYQPENMFALDAWGGFACVGSVSAGGESDQEISFSDPSAFMRKELLITGSSPSDGVFDIDAVITNDAWQLPSETPRSWMAGALYSTGAVSFLDSAGNRFFITGQYETGEFAAGKTRITLAPSAPVANGQASIADAHTPGAWATRSAETGFRLHVGDFSLMPSGLWDARLRSEAFDSYWSFMPGGGSDFADVYAPRPSDVLLWVSGNYEALGTVTATKGGAYPSLYNELTDSTAAWIPGALTGHYVIPNWNTRRLYRITGNSETALYLEPNDRDLNIEAVARAGSTYVILSQRDAYSYARLVAALPSFAPKGANVYVRFEPVKDYLLESPDNVLGIIETGQSLSVGATAYPPITTMPVPGHLRLAGMQALLPTLITPTTTWTAVDIAEPPREFTQNLPHPNNVEGETGATYFASLAEGAYRGRMKTAHSLVGKDGWAMYLIAKNGVTEPNDSIEPGRSFSAAIDEVTAFKRILNSQGKSYEVAAVILTHGESDYADTAYNLSVRQMQQDYDHDVRAITGQATRIPLILSQASAGMYASLPVSLAVHESQRQAGILWPNDIFVSGPKYQYEFSPDNLHLTAQGYRDLARKNWQVFNEVRRGRGWVPLQPISAEASGSRVTLTMAVPHGPLVFDSALWDGNHSVVNTEWTNGKGFELYNGATKLTIASVSIAGNIVYIDTAAPLPAATDISVAYAFLGDGDGKVRRGQLRDSDPWQPNWCLHFANVTATTP
jgi:hypothetical protein